jgi:hypothetical protein
VLLTPAITGVPATATTTVGRCHARRCMGRSRHALRRCALGLRSWSGMLLRWPRRLPSCMLLRSPRRGTLGLRVSGRSLVLLRRLATSSGIGALILGAMRGNLAVIGRMCLTPSGPCLLTGSARASCCAVGTFGTPGRIGLAALGMCRHATFVVRRPLLVAGCGGFAICRGGVARCAIRACLGTILAGRLAMISRGRVLAADGRRAICAWTSRPRRHDPCALELTRTGSCRYRRTPTIGRSPQLGIAARRVTVAELSLGCLLPRVPCRLQLSTRGCRTNAAATVEGGSARTDVHHAPVIDVGYVGVADIGDRAVVVHMATAPVPAVEAVATIAEAIIDATVKADGWTPIAGMEAIYAA